ncbi:MAG: 2-isopropylmalate synthase, partial [Chloroflexi bacterium]|nr:2-isopropylmalate synthase [Chloroflexota bacterium]
MTSKLHAAKARDLIYDWNVQGRASAYPSGVELDDETLRDGLQSPSVLNPPVEQKIELLRLMDALGIHTADIGYAGSSARTQQDIVALAQASLKLNIKVNVACRTTLADIGPAVECAQKAGCQIEVSAFLGCSPIRRYAEDWDFEKMMGQVEESVTFVVRHGLPCMFVTEDTTRADPESMRLLYSKAIECGAAHVCVSDTVGHATPDGAYNVVSFVKGIVGESGAAVTVDWHGHQDRGLGVANTLAAIAAGAGRVHGCALGIGERCGNTPMDTLLVNLKLLGIIEHDLTRLPEYVRLASAMTGIALPVNYPVVGADAYRTATGVHASAVVKALAKNDLWLANRVYSGVPADW